MAKAQAQNTDGKPSGARHLAGNVVGILLIVLLLPIMVINTTLIIKSYAQKNKVPSFMGVAPLIVLSGSMKETIQINDLIFVKEVDPDILVKGDIIAFQPVGDKTVVTHRIVAVQRDEEGRVTYTTKGDNNNTEDKEPCYQFQVVGRYFGRLPGLGKVADFLQQPLGMILCVGLPLAGFVLYDVLRRVMYNRRKQEEDDSAQVELDAAKEELERLRALAASIEMGEFPQPAAAEAAPPKKLDITYPPVEGEDRA